MRKNIALPLVALFIASSGSAFCAESATPTETQISPVLHFIRPMKDERFFDFPIYVQLLVSGVHLAAPDDAHAAKPRPNVAHIQYKFDDFPVISTDDTQFMIGKWLGNEYLPVGLHVLKAELVDDSGKPLNPPVQAVTELFTGHPAVVETIHTTSGSEKAELTGAELYQMRTHLERIENELKKLKTGNAGFSPTPLAGPAPASE